MNTRFPRILNSLTKALVLRTTLLEQFYFVTHCDLKVSSSPAKIDENFAKYFFKNKANIESFTVLKSTYKGLQKSISV